MLGGKEECIGCTCYSCNFYISRSRQPYSVTETHLQLYNIITHAYIPDEYVSQILNADITGQKLYEDYVAERINGEVSI